MQLKEYAKRKTKRYSKQKSEAWKIKILRESLRKDSKILDIGCGSGNISKLIKNKKNYYGIDYNEYMVEFCKKNKLNVKVCDIAREKLPFDSGFFDIIWCSHVLEHLDSREQIRSFKEFSRVLKKRGKIILFAPTPYHWYFWDDFTHTRPCTHGQLKDLASNAGFSKTISKYSKTRAFPENLQWLLRLPPLRFFLWEVFLIAKK